METAKESAPAGESAVKSAAVDVVEGLGWGDVKRLIMACRQLPFETRQYLTAIGELAVSADGSEGD
jgi:hypothetical protein